MTYPTAMARLTHTLKLLICSTLALLPLCLPSGARAAGFEELYRFPRFGTVPNGIVRAPTGHFYGVTNAGGLSGLGTLFRISMVTSKVETLANFGGLAGREPLPQIVADAAGNVYGLSDFGSTVWHWNEATGLRAVGNLYKAKLAGAITGLTMDSGGGLIGTAEAGGQQELGVLWRWHPTTGAQRLGEFTAVTTGRTTKTRVAIDSEGAIYGCSDASSDEMILWRWKSSMGFEKLATLSTNDYGQGNLGLTIDSSGQVWGDTMTGGPQHDGTLWRWSQAAGLEKLGDFNLTNSGQGAESPVAFGPEGAAYGISSQAIWKWTSADGLVRHSNLSAVGPARGTIAFDEAGTIYGTSSSAVWKWTAGTGAVIVQRFRAAGDPEADFGIARDPQGRFYGTTYSQEGGTTVLWRWSDSLGYEVLSNFPIGTPVIDQAGSVYVVNGSGNLFRWNEAQGAVQVSTNNPATDGHPNPEIVIGDQGQIYGTTEIGNNARAWKWTAEGGFVLLNSFGSSGIGFSPNQIRGANGEWYGVYYGSEEFGGSLWSWSEAGGFVVHYSFEVGMSNGPQKILTRAPSGDIYGIMGFSLGTKLWRWSAASGFSILASFEAGIVLDHHASILAGADGIVRGVCSNDGAYNLGRLWAWSETGGLCNIHHFDPQHGGYSYANSLVTDAAGNLCGLANGLIWRYVDTPQPGAPSVATGSVVQNDESIVAIAGAVNANGVQAVSNLRWGCHPSAMINYGYVLPEAVIGSVFRPVTGKIPDKLPQRTLVFACISSTNSVGVTDGNTVSFISANHAPETEPDEFHGPPIAAGAFDIDVLANDHDGDDDLYLKTVTQGEYGVTDIVNNKIRYTPKEGYTGQDFISYTVKDLYGGESIDRLTLINSPIAAVDDIALLDQDSLSVAINPLANDTDPDGDVLSIAAFTQGVHGTVTFSGQQVTYSREPGYIGSDYFTYTVTDGRGLYATATVEVRPAEVIYSEVFTVGGTLPTNIGIVTVKQIGSSGSLHEGFSRLEVQADGQRRWILLDATDLSVRIQAEHSLSAISGSTVKSIEEPAGRAVSVKYTEEGKPGKPRRAVLFLNSDGTNQLVTHEGELLPDGATVTTITNFTEANSSVFVLAKVRLANGKTAQSLRVWYNGFVEELARTGTTQVSEQLVKSITTLVPAPGSTGDNRWIDDAVRIATRLTFQDGSQAQVVLEPRGYSELWAQTGFSNVAGGLYLRLGLPALAGNGVAFRAFERQEAHTQFWSLYGPAPEFGLEWLAHKGMFAVDPQMTFTQFMDPIAGDPGELACVATIANKTRSTKALFRIDGNDRKLIIREGDLLPGQGKEKLIRIKSIAYPRNTQRGPLFTAVTSKGLGLWATDENQTVFPVVKPGMKLTTDGTERTVASIQALEGTKLPALAARGYDDSGHVEALVKFTDGTKSLIHFALP